MGVKVDRNQFPLLLLSWKIALGVKMLFRWCTEQFRSWFERTFARSVHTSVATCWKRGLLNCFHAFVFLWIQITLTRRTVEENPLGNFKKFGKCGFLVIVVLAFHICLHFSLNCIITTATVSGFAVLSSPVRIVHVADAVRKIAIPWNSFLVQTANLVLYGAWVRGFEEFIELLESFRLEIVFSSWQLRRVCKEWGRQEVWATEFLLWNL